MAIQKKHGKGRLDKWYKLAKEKGYRARAAFKLIQLNRRFGFLEKSKVLLDLCAAPGSWCQVAAETMPANSLIIGVDLAPIKPIARAITFQSDITTPHCRSTIRQHLKTWKVDTVLHDGSPNVGRAWVQDAFSQAELVLESLKLATEFLTAGGTFVTKVFRSKDYNSLLWVFNQLFVKVEATKPPSSRSISAEIFVVCRGFKAPKRMDPRFLDPRSVFADLSDPTPNNEAKVYNPEKKKRKREGYAEGDYTQYKEVLASEFIETSDPLAILASVNKLSLAQSGNGDVALAALDRLPETTTEIRALCEDLKVLGRKDFRLLLKWRLRARELFGFSTNKSDTKDDEAGEAEEVAEVTPMDEELRAQEDLQQMKDKENARKKKERRRENEKRQKEIVRMQLNMTVPDEIGLEQSGPQGEGAMFKIRAVQQADALDRIARGRMATLKPTPTETLESEDDESDDAEDALEQELDDLFSQYQQRRLDTDAKYRAKKARTEDSDGEWEGVSDNGSVDSDDLEEDEDSNYGSDDEANNTTATTRVLPPTTNGTLSNKAAFFFAQDIFKDIEGGEEEAEEDIDQAEGAELSSGLIESSKPLQIRSVQAIAQTERSSSGSSTETLVEVGVQGQKQPSEGMKDHDDDEESDVEVSKGHQDNEDEAGFEIVKNTASEWDKQDELGADGRLNIEIITAEAMTRAHEVATGKKSKHDLIDEGFHKYAMRDKEGLPEWFLDDEGKHSKLQKPITAAAAAAIKEKLRVLNARPIKKVREAKDRKKMRAAQRLERLKKKSALLADDEGMSEKDKAQSIAKLMSKAAKKKPRKKVTVVFAGGQNKGGGRPKGVRGKYRMVDARGKKDLRALKRLAKKRK